MVRILVYFFQMTRYLLAIVAYPAVWWLTVFAGSLIIVSIKLYNAPVIGVISLLLPFVTAPLASGWIAQSRPRLIAFLGTLLHHILWVIFTPIVMSLLAIQIGTPPTEVSTTTPETGSVEIAMTFKVLAIIFFPIAAIISVICGIFVAKLKRQKAGNHLPKV